MGTDFHKDGQIRPAAGAAPEIAVALLTGGSDRLCLRPGDGADVQGEALDLIGSAELDFPEFTNPE